jgi:hypothetical protein
MAHRKYDLIQLRTCCLPFYAIKEEQQAGRVQCGAPGAQSRLVRFVEGDLPGSWFDCFATGQCNGLCTGDTLVAQQLCLCDPCVEYLRARGDERGSARFIRRLGVSNPGAAALFYEGSFATYREQLLGLLRTPRNQPPPPRRPEPPPHLQQRAAAAQQPAVEEQQPAEEAQQHASEAVSASQEPEGAAAGDQLSGLTALQDAEDAQQAAEVQQGAPSSALERIVRSIELPGARRARELGESSPDSAAKRYKVTAPPS